MAEFRRLLATWPLEVLFPEDIGLAESPDEAGLERFETFGANALAKARWFAERSGLPTLADDSGLEVDALDGAPGVRSKRFAGLDSADAGTVAAANIALLLERLRDVPAERRTARYRAVLVVGWPQTMGHEPPDVAASGIVEGRIVEQPAGTAGFGYDPLFFSDELGCTFGEATPEEKARVSHRSRALGELAPVLEALAR